MKLTFDTTFIDHILNRWGGGEENYRQALQQPIYRWLLRHQSQFLQREPDPEEYLEQLLHIDGIDMAQREEEIRRNLDYILSINLEEVVTTVQKYLPESVSRDDAVISIHFVIGIAGLSAYDHLILDPSPCPWFVNDGSDREFYLNGHVLPTIRHEMHHVGYMRIRHERNTDELATRGDLALDLLQETQMEGGAKVCEKDDQEWDLTEEGHRDLFAAAKRLEETTAKWFATESAAIEALDWSEYFSFWESGELYLLGEYMNKAMLAQKVYETIGDCMLAEPLEWFRKGRTVLRMKLN